MRDKDLEDPERPLLEFEKPRPWTPERTEKFRWHMQPTWDLIDRIEKQIRVPHWRRQKPFTV